MPGLPLQQKTALTKPPEMELLEVFTSGGYVGEERFKKRRSVPFDV